MVNNHGDRKTPKNQVVGPPPNGFFMADINGCSKCVVGLLDERIPRKP